ncbi:short-chain dehydrogenase [Alphaproteobacteria bacterium 46_93_T64]|nr:short-chain dehydrogenase [Alphaproteobacteria bacterium 46_93_T64]
MNELAGKVALITGASKGIGAATAIELAKNGVNVVLAARSINDLEALKTTIVEGGGKAETIVCDVSIFKDVSAAVDLCVSTYGHLDILVNNAGIIDPIATIADSDPEMWGHVVDVNYKGVYHGLRAAIPVMKIQKSGVIVNISSGAATGALEGWSHYCSTKAAVLSLTRCADKECREDGITVVGLSPGTVATDMQTSIRHSGINPISQLDPSVHIKADWPARAVAWLCTQDAKEFAGTDFSIKTDEGRKRVGLI